MTTPDDPTITPSPEPGGLPIKDAATFLLLREHDGGVQVFTIRRASTMVFAGGVVAFPGGGVDRGDYDTVPMAGPDFHSWAARLGVEPARAGSIVTAAVRECFEETGVLLAAAADGGDAAAALLAAGIDDSSAAQWRRRLDKHEVPLSSFLETAGLIADTTRLKELSRWITPPGNPRRYDTFFFAVPIADGEGPDGSSAEFDASGWAYPQDVLAAWERDEVTLLPPTIVHLRQLVEAGSIEAFMQRPAEMAPIRNDLRPEFGV